MNTLVLEHTENGDVAVDVYQKLSDDRILFVYDEITDNLATDLCATLLLKNSESSDKKITLFINSPGGDIRNVFMIYDMIQLIQAPIETICIGAAMDEAVLLLASGHPGMRFATKNCRIAVNQLVHDWIMNADMSDAKKILDIYTSDNKKMMEILAKCTKKTVKQITSDFDRRVFMTAIQAAKYGIIDRVIAQNRG